MGISDRLYNIAKSYLDSAKSRWDEVDPAAQQELDAAVSSPALSAWDRAQAKINNAQAANTAAKELQPAPVPAQTFNPQQPVTAPGSQPQTQQQASTNALAGAYRVLDVPPGSDLQTVQVAYRELQKKADPTRFPEGSKDRKLAEDILRRVNAAYMVLANSLSAATDDRFDRLEL
jgi:DnaJ-domain-containing protein 1